MEAGITDAMVTALAPLAAMGSVASGQVIERDGGWWTTDADGEWSFSTERPASTIDLERATTVGGLMEAAGAGSERTYKWWNIWGVVDPLPDGSCPEGHHKNGIGLCIRTGELTQGVRDGVEQIGDVVTGRAASDMFQRIGTAALGAVLIFGGIILAGGMRAVSVNLAQASGVKYKVGG